MRPPTMAPMIADDDVDERAEAVATHDLSGEEAGDQADDEPDEERVGALGGLDVAVDVDVMDVRFHDASP